MTVTQDPTPAYADSGTLKLTFTPQDKGVFTSGQQYSLLLTTNSASWNQLTQDDFGIMKTIPNISANASNNSVLQVTTSTNDISNLLGKTDVTVYYVIRQGGTDFGINLFGWFGQPFNPNQIIYAGSFHIFPKGNKANNGTTTGIPALNIKSKIQQNTQATVYIDNAAPNQDYTLWWNGDKGAISSFKFKDSDLAKGNDPFSPDQQAGSVQFNVGAAGEKTLCLTTNTASGPSVLSLPCDYHVDVSITATPPPADTPMVQSNNPGVPSVAPGESVNNSGELAKSYNGYPTPTLPCSDNGVKNGNCTSYPSAIGNIDTSPAGFVKAAFSLILGLAGGIAVLLIIIAGYQFMVSQGNPERIQAARERLISAIVGLLFIILSIVILQVIGVDLLAIPGLTR